MSMAQRTGRRALFGPEIHKTRRLTRPVHALVISLWCPDGDGPHRNVAHSWTYACSPYATITSSASGNALYPLAHMLAQYAPVS
jgi:hypothetical protein